MFLVAKTHQRSVVENKLTKFVILVCHPFWANKAFASYGRAEKTLYVLRDLHSNVLIVERLVVVQLGTQSEEEVEPATLDIGNNKYNDIIAKVLSPYIQKRSSLSVFLEPRIREVMEKNAFANIYPEGERPESVSPDDYWLESGPGTGSLIETSPISDKIKILGGLAALYAGLKLKAAGYGPKQIVEIFVNRPWLRTLVGGGDTIAATEHLGLEDKFSFVSTSGGAMLKFLLDGTLVGIKALESSK